MIIYVKSLVFPETSVLFSVHLTPSIRPVEASKNNVEQKTCSISKEGVEIELENVFENNIRTASFKWHMLTTLNAKPCRIMTHVVSHVMLRNPLRLGKRASNPWPESIGRRDGALTLKRPSLQTIRRWRQFCVMMTDTFNVSEKYVKILRAACKNSTSIRCIVGWNYTQYKIIKSYVTFKVEPDLASAPHARSYR